MTSKNDYSRSIVSGYTFKEHSKAEIKKNTTKSRQYKGQNPWIKVLTSATFVRAVFGILKKVI